MDPWAIDPVKTVQHKSRARCAAAAFTLMSASACTQGPDYQRPIIEVPSTYRFDAVAPHSPTSGQNLWWQEFGDDALNRLIRECISENRDLRVATARVDEAAAVLVGARSQGLPQVGYAIDGTRQRATESGPGGAFPAGVSPISSSFGTLLSASWEVDLWGRIRRETEAARANLLATAEARRGVVLTLVASVITTYITLLDLDERLKVAESTVEGRKESVTLFQTRLDAGYVSDFEMMQVQAEYESAISSIPELKRQIAQQEHALSILVGRNPGSIERGRDLAGLGTPKIPASLPAELLARRPDIMQAEQQLIASNALIGSARALYFPKISLTTVGGFASAALGNLFTGPARTWSFTGDVAGPIFTGGGLQSATDQTFARREQSLAAYERAVQNAFREVDDALISLRSTRETEQSLARRVQALQVGVRLARARYDNGYADYLDVLDTERGLFSAELSLAAARGDTHRALVALYRALGGDWIERTSVMMTPADHERSQ